MTRPLARRVWPRLAAIVTVLLTAAAALPRAQTVAAPPAVQRPIPPRPDGPIALQSAEVRDFLVLTGENPGAALRLEPVGATTTR